MQNLGYYNGSFGLIEEMKIPMTDRGFYFGDGIYDAAYSRNHIVYALDEHIERFYRNLGFLHIRPYMEPTELQVLIEDLVNRVDDGEQFVYWQMTRGSGLREHSFPEEAKGNLCIMLRPVKVRDLTQSMRIISYPDKRYEFCNMKTLNILPSVLAAEAAKEAGVDECVLHRKGRVTECSHSNISMFGSGVLITPPADEWILPGIGREHLMKACREIGIPVEERPFTLGELMEADEIVITSAGTLCADVCSIDGKPVGGKDPATLRKVREILVNDWLQKTEK